MQNDKILKVIKNQDWIYLSENIEFPITNILILENLTDLIVESISNNKIINNKNNRSDNKKIFDERDFVILFVTKIMNECCTIYPINYKIYETIAKYKPWYLIFNIYTNILCKTKFSLLNKQEKLFLEFTLKCFTSKDNGYIKLLLDKIPYIDNKEFVSNIINDCKNKLIVNHLSSIYLL